MKNYIQMGKTLTLIAPAAIVSGAGVLVGSIFGVATGDADNGDEVEVMTEGVFDLTKVGAQAWAQGAKVYWDDAAKNCTTTATGNTLIGCAARAAAASDTVGRVWLNL
tara:strand:- start:4176 stop:4499 length:324 start_codon:yes stop_codon:yes gene_type:complete